MKDASSAKSRLGVAGEHTRARLMAAFARDCIAAAAACDLVRVHVVGDPTQLGAVLAGLDVEVLMDEGAGSLNLALRRAAGRVDPALGTAALLADLPCLRTADLTAALASITSRSFVADSAGTGTTLLVAPAGTALDPRFGRDSARAHAESGAVPIGQDLTSLRLDVDTTEDLEHALRFGVGASTAVVASQLA